MILIFGDLNLVKEGNEKRNHYLSMRAIQVVCNTKSLAIIILLYVVTIILIKYLNVSVYPIVENPLSKSLSLGTLNGILLYTFLPLIFLVLVLAITTLARSLIIGILAFLSIIYYLGEESFFQTSMIRYTGLFIIAVVAMFLGLFLLIYIVSQFLGGYLDSALSSIKYRENKFIATSIALTSLSIEVFVHTSLWPKDPLGSILMILSIILTVIGFLLLNNSIISLIFATLSGLGWPVTFLTYLFISFQPATLKKYSKSKGFCLSDLRIVGVSNRIPASRNMLKAVAFRWSLKGIECTKSTEPCIPLGHKLIIHAYGMSAKKVLLSIIRNLNFRIICLSCNKDFWREAGEPLSVAPENITSIEERKPKMVFVKSPEDYAYSVAIELSKTANSDEVVIVDGIESLFFNTKLLRATLKELISSFRMVILVSNYLDYYLLSNHVFRFSSIETFYIIGNAQNKKVMRELLKDFLDIYVIDNIIEHIAVGKYLALFPVMNKLFLLRSCSSQ